MAIPPVSPSDPSCSAIVLGSTGNVGRQIVNMLAASPAVQQIVLVNRRPADGFAALPKVHEIVLPDMENLAETTERVAKESGATLGFCAIGVGKGSQAMSEAEVRKIEVQYPEAFVNGCKAGGVVSMGVLTAVGSDINSSIRYVRIIGEKEKAVTGVGIPALGVYKPSVILGNSNTPTYLHYLYPAVQWVLPSRFHAIHTGELARAMFNGTQKALAELQKKRVSTGKSLPPEIAFYEYSEMKQLFKQEEA
jgi:uncharacterized protein YbjT (DUF2867 family)